MANNPYRLRDIPAHPDGRASRFAIASSPMGWSAAPGDTLCLAAETLLKETRAAAEPLAPEMAELEVKRVGITAEGGYVLVSLGLVRCPRRFVNRRRGTFSGLASKLGAGGVFDSLLLGGEAFGGSRGVPDDGCWDALRAVCEHHALNPVQCRRLSDVMALLLLCRAGADVANKWELGRLLLDAKPVEAEGVSA
jgi:hypothetical protein